MTINNKVAGPDIEQITYENEAESKRTLLVGKTSGGEYVPFQVNSDGKLVTSGGGGALALDDLTDVTLTSPAVGAILYYTGTEWANLVAPTGTAFSYQLVYGDSIDTLTWSPMSSPTTPNWSSVLFAGNSSGANNATMSTNTQLRFRDTATYINSSTANQMNLVAPTFAMTLTTAWTVSAAGLGFGTSGFLKNTSGGSITGGNSVDISTDTNLAATTPIVLTGDTLSHADSAVTPGTYRSVTVDQKGHVTGGTNPTIDISSDTNLAVTSPITLTGDTVGFSFATNNTWTGTNLFQNTVTVEDDTKLFIGDNSLASGNISFINDQTTTGHFIIAGENGFAGSIYTNLNLIQNSSGLALATFGATFTGAPVVPASSSDAVAIFKSTTSAAIRALTVQAGWTGTSTSANGINGFNAFCITGTGATGSLTATAQGGGIRNRNVARHRATNAAATLTKASALSLIYTSDASTATVTNGVALNIEGWSIGASSTTTNAYGILFEAPAVSGTLTNGYFIYIPAMTAATNNYEVWLDSDATIFFRAATNYIQSSAASTLDFVANTTANIRVGSTVEIAVTATNIDLGSATTDTVNFIAGADGTAPTLAGAAPVFTNYYGGNTNALGDPNSWLRIKRNGTTYKIPLYT